MTEAETAKTTEQELPDANENKYGIVFDDSAADEVKEVEESTEEAEPAAESEETQTEELASENESEEAEANSESAPEDVEDEPDNVQKRINKITAEKYEEKRKNEALQKELNDLKSLSSKELGARPAIDDFDTHEAYEDALNDWRLDQREKERAAQREKELLQESQQQLQESYNRKVQDFTAKNADFVDTVTKVPVMPDPTLNAIMALDNGPQIAYYLGKHLDVAYEVASSDPLLAAIKIGEINASLKAVKTTQKKTSDAPEPVKTVQKGAVSKAEISTTGVRLE